LCTQVDIGQRPYRVRTSYTGIWGMWLIQDVYMTHTQLSSNNFYSYLTTPSHCVQLIRKATCSDQHWSHLGRKQVQCWLYPIIPQDLFLASALKSSFRLASYLPFSLCYIIDVRFCLFNIYWNHPAYCETSMADCETLGVKIAKARPLA